MEIIETTASEIELGDVLVSVDGFSRFTITRLYKTDRRVAVMLSGLAPKDFRPDAQVRIERAS